MMSTSASPLLVRFFVSSADSINQNIGVKEAPRVRISFRVLSWS